MIVTQILQLSKNGTEIINKETNKGIFRLVHDLERIHECAVVSSTMEKSFRRQRVNNLAESRGRCNSTRECPLTFTIGTRPSISGPVRSTVYHYEFACAAPGHSRLISSRFSSSSISSSASFRHFPSSSCW